MKLASSCGALPGAAALLALAVDAAASGGLPDGAYDCGGGYTYRHMGIVDIKGNQFRYRPFDEQVAGFGPYTVNAGGTIHGGGHFGGLDDLPLHR